jgi:DNA excision repair protein ERCC-4
METPTPTVIQDTREQCPLVIEAYPVEIATLPVGDYGVKGFSDWNNPAFIVERKSLGDLVGSLTSGHDRFMREIEGLRRFRFAAILVEADWADVASHTYRGAANPASLLAMLAAIQVRAGVHVFWCGSATQAARQFEGLVRQFCRGVIKDAKRLGVAGPGLAWQGGVWRGLRFIVNERRGKCMRGRRAIN